MLGLTSARWVTTVLVVLTFALALAAAPRTASADGIGTCDPQLGKCDVGTGGGGGPGNGGGGAGSDPCAPYPGAVYGSKPPAVSQACADELQGRFCSATLVDILGGLKTAGADLTPQQAALVNRELAATGCPPIVTTATLAQQGFATIVFPHPSGHRSPSESQLYQGYPFTYVGLWTFYWTDSATWRPLTATASADGLTATVSAKPTSLVFNPGDGSPSQSCAGPGRPWVESDANGPPNAGACGYQYVKVTGPGYDHPVTSTQTIVWAITWTGTGATGGELAGLSTSTSGQLNVMQIEIVNR